MGISLKGFGQQLSGSTITLKIADSHRLVKLGNAIDWQALADIVMPDLKATEKGWWRVGRKLKLRIHLGVYLLQQILNIPDRAIEQAIQDNAAYQIFCGKTLIRDWHCPDHSKINTFRNRLSPQTHCALANAISHCAVTLGFANPAHVDIDSTVQEADMQYPASSSLLVKTAVVAKTIQKLVLTYLPEKAGELIEVNLKTIKGIARNYWFTKHKSVNQEQKAGLLKQLWEQVSAVTLPMVRLAQYLAEPYLLATLRPSEQSLVLRFIDKAPRLLTGLFERCYEALPRKIDCYSYFRDSVHCFNKGKAHKSCEFGRQFQIARIEGNFLYSIPNNSVQMFDPHQIKPMLKQHIELFQTPIESLVTDKGYYSKDNEKFALELGIEKVAIQRPRRKLDKPPDNPLTDEQLEPLVNRRAGIEAIIGHLKQDGQMGRSRMRLDDSTESSGYTSILGFNCRQLMNRLTQVEGNAVTT